MTTGPKSFSVALISKLLGSENPPEFKFKLIDYVIPEVDKKLLSKVQQYLLYIFKAIQVGVPRTNPGLLTYSRWLTTANRVLRVRRPLKKFDAVSKHHHEVLHASWFPNL